MPQEDRTDLAEFVGTGSPAAFERLAGRYAGLVYGVCRRRLGNADDAEDAGQAVFLALARKARSVRPEKLASWLHGAAIRAAKTLARSRATRARREEEAARMRRVGTEPAGENWTAVRPHLDAEVERLPVRMREAVARHYFAGLSYAQIGAELGLAKTTVASRVQAGLERLRGRLRRRGLSLGAAAFGALLAENAAPGAPAGFLSSLPQLATGSAAAGAAAGAGLSASAIAEGVLRMMFMEKLRVIGAALAAAAVVSVAVPVAVNAVRAGEKPKAAPAAAVPAPPALKPEWRGKLLVQLAAAASDPVWSPDGKRVACCLALKRERGRGYMKTTEGGVGVLELATGRLSQVSVNKSSGISGLAWMPDGGRLIAAGGEQLWSVEVTAGRLKARPLARLPGKLFTRPGRHGMSLSPDGKFLLCELRKESSVSGPLEYVLLDGAGKRVASLKGHAPLWSPEGGKLYFARYEKLCCVELPGGKQETIFSSGDYFKAGAPKTHKGWTWSPRPVAALKNGGLAVDVCEAPGSGLEGKRMPPGVVIITGEMFTWSRKDGKNVFSKLGPTRSGLHGEIRYIPMGREGLLLRTESTRGFRQGKTNISIVKADTGKVLLDIKPPRTARHNNQDINLGLSLLAAHPDGDTAVFSSSGSVTDIHPKIGRVGRVQWFGLYLLDVPAGVFKRVELPLSRRPHEVSIAPGSNSLILTGRLKDKKTKDGKYIEGVWLCDPEGRGVVHIGEAGQAPQSGNAF